MGIVLFRYAIPFNAEGCACWSLHCSLLPVSSPSLFLWPWLLTVHQLSRAIHTGVPGGMSSVYLSEFKDLPSTTWCQSVLVPPTLLTVYLTMSETHGPPIQTPPLISSIS